MDGDEWLLTQQKVISSSSSHTIAISGSVPAGCGAEIIEMNVFRVGTSQPIETTTFNIGNGPFDPNAKFKVFGSNAAAPVVINGTNNMSLDILSGGIVLNYGFNVLCWQYIITIEEVYANGNNVPGGIYASTGNLTGPVPSTIDLTHSLMHNTQPAPNHSAYYTVALRMEPVCCNASTHTALIHLLPAPVLKPHVSKKVAPVPGSGHE